MAENPEISKNSENGENDDFYPYLDFIAAADVFMYLGDLRLIFENSYKILKNNGILIFTVEALVDEKKENENIWIENEILTDELNVFHNNIGQIERYDGVKSRNNNDSKYSYSNTNTESNINNVQNIITNDNESKNENENENDVKNEKENEVEKEKEIEVEKEKEKEIETDNVVTEISNIYISEDELNVKNGEDSSTSSSSLRNILAGKHIIPTDLKTETETEGNINIDKIAACGTSLDLEPCIPDSFLDHNSFDKSAFVCSHIAETEQDPFIALSDPLTVLAVLAVLPPCTLSSFSPSISSPVSPLSLLSPPLSPIPPIPPLLPPPLLHPLTLYLIYPFLLLSSASIPPPLLY